MLSFWSLFIPRFNTTIRLSILILILSSSSIVSIYNTSHAIAQQQTQELKKTPCLKLADRKYA